MTRATAPAATAPAPASETALLKQILVALNRMPGVLFWRRNVGAMQSGDAFVRFGMPGQADIEGIAWGLHVEIEVKRPAVAAVPGKRRRSAGVQSPEQHLWQAAVARAGGVYILARSVDEAVEAVVVLRPTGTSF